MWRRIVETGERDGTLRALGAEYDDVDPARLRSDLDGFVTALVGRGLLLKDSPG
jgi:hypothetical protein